MRKTGLNDIHPFICGSFNPSVHLEAFFESLLYTRYTRGVIDVERKVAAPALEFSLKKATGKRHSPFRVGSSMRLWENMGVGPSLDRMFREINQEKMTCGLNLKNELLAR